MISFFAPHLLESTAFAAVVCFVAICSRRRGPAVRHSIWLIAAAKFAVPAALLSALGVYVHSLFPSLHSLVAISENLSRFLPAQTAMPITTGPLTEVWIFVSAVWLTGTFVALIMWFRHLLASFESSREPSELERESLLRMQRRLAFRRNVKLRLSMVRSEPILSGIWHPAITIPQGLCAKLTPGELDALMLHELAHAKRWDNLTGAFVHVLACFFWFHPLLWWIERRMISERELACDEIVVRNGAPPEDYVASILKVCHFRVASVVAGVSDIASSDLKKRMEEIMSYSTRRPVSWVPKLLLGAFLAAMTIAPLMLGFLRVSTAHGQAKPQGKASSTETNNQAPVTCVHASKEYPEGTVIQEGQGPEQMCTRALIPDPTDPDRVISRPRWVRTNDAIRERARTVVHLPQPPPFVCKPKTSTSENLCSCEGAELGFSKGAIVDSAEGKLRCDNGKWRPATGKELGYPN